VSKRCPIHYIECPFLSFFNLIFSFFLSNSKIFMKRNQVIWKFYQDSTHLCGLCIKVLGCSKKLNRVKEHFINCPIFLLQISENSIPKPKWMPIIANEDSLKHVSVEEQKIFLYKLPLFSLHRGFLSILSKIHNSSMLWRSFLQTFS
jgi:hypothetical protein